MHLNWIGLHASDDGNEKYLIYFIFQHIESINLFSNSFLKGEKFSLKISWKNLSRDFSEDIEDMSMVKYLSLRFSQCRKNVYKRKTNIFQPSSLLPIKY